MEVIGARSVQSEMILSEDVSCIVPRCNQVIELCFIDFVKLTDYADRGVDEVRMSRR